MIDCKMKEVLERTEKTLCDHLVDLNDQVDQVGHIQNPMVLDGIKDVVKSLKYIKEIKAGCDFVAVNMAANAAPGAA